MNGKKPTRYQRQFLQENSIDPREWYVQKDSPDKMQIVNIHTGEVKVLLKCR